MTSPTPNLTAATEALRTAAEHVTGFTSRIDNYRTTMTDVQRDIERIVSGPRNAADLEREVRRVVGEIGHVYARDEAPALVFSERALASPEGTGASGIDMRRVESFACLCAIDPEAAVQRLLAVVRLVPYEPGPALAERPALVACKQAELDAMGAEEERLVDEAITLGLAIEHRPEVRARRAQEARQRELAARHDAEQAEQKRSLDTQHATKQSGTPSAYLEGQRNPYR